MRYKCLLLMILICLPLISLSLSADAGEKARMMVKVPHAFTVGDQLLPAGRYSVACTEGDPAELHIHDTTGAACARLSVITRLAQDSHHDTDARMVFDRLGGQHYLSEVWLNGEDGYLVRGTPREHSHEIIHFGS